MILVVSVFLTKLADTVLNPKITLTALLQTQGAPDQLISLLVPLRESGSLLPQAWMAGYAARFRKLGPMYYWGTMAQGIAALSMLLCALTLEGNTASWGVITALAALSVARALSSMSYKVVLGKNIPSGLRGQTNGWASSATGLAAIACAVMLLLLPNDSDRQIIIFLLGLSTLAYWTASALFIRIPEIAKSNDNERSGNTFIKRCVYLINDADFKQYIIARALLVSTGLAAPWYVLLGVSSNSILASVGALLLANGLASFISSPFWGHFSDRSSRWVLQTTASSVATLGLFTVVLFGLMPSALQSIWVIALLYFCLETAHQGVRIARKTYVIDLSDNDNRLEYVSVSNTLIGIIIIAVGSLSALAANWLAPIEMIAAFSVLSACGSWYSSKLKAAF